MPESGSGGDEINTRLRLHPSTNASDVRRREMDEEVMSGNDLGWHVIAGDHLLEVLRRVENGEKADLVYAELLADAEQENYREEE